MTGNSGPNYRAALDAAKPVGFYIGTSWRSASEHGCYAVMRQPFGFRGVQ